MWIRGGMSSEDSQSVLTTTLCSNLVVLMSLNGEPGWVCLMCCNSDSECLCPVYRKFLVPPRLELVIGLNTDIRHHDSTLQRHSHPMGDITRQRPEIRSELEAGLARTRGVT